MVQDQLVVSKNGRHNPPSLRQAGPDVLQQFKTIQVLLASESELVIHLTKSFYRLGPILSISLQYLEMA